MQVARTFFLTREKTLARKLSEVLLAFKIEANLTKDQILELYINQIFLGQRAYGFQSAANVYFGKNLSELSPAEAAMLAGLPQAPSRQNPFVNASAPRSASSTCCAACRKWAGCRATNTRRPWPSRCA
jgi:penicillin-binding protein 1A